MTSVLHRGLRGSLPLATSARGIRILLEDGREIIDASSGPAVTCLGYGDARVVEAVRAQMETLPYVHSGFFANEPAEALAQFLVDSTSSHFARVGFLSSGSEAVEAALKLARQYFMEIGEPQRIHFIARRQSYHGNTLAALALGGHRARRQIYEPLLGPTFSHVSPCFAYHYQAPGETDAAYVQRLAAELEAEFQRVGPDKVAAFCAEPVVGAASGCVTAVPGYFEAMRAVCDRHGALLILDEIMSGMGRTGTLHAWEQEGVRPDIQVVAKGLGGGFQSISAVLASHRVVQALSKGSGVVAHGQTYQSHPVACAAALAVQHIIRDDDLLTNVREMGELLGDALRTRFADHPFVGDVRGRGLFWALEFVADKASKRAFDPGANVSDRIKQCGLAAGLAIYPSAGTVDGVRGDHAIVAPAYIVTPEEIHEIVDRMEVAVRAMTWDLPSDARSRPRDVPDAVML